MNKILVITVLLIGCMSEEIIPVQTFENITELELANDVNILISRISILVLMNSDITKEPFDDLQLLTLNDFILKSKILPNSISAEKIASHILQKIEEGTPHSEISKTIILDYQQGAFQKNH